VTICSTRFSSLRDRHDQLPLIVTQNPYRNEDLTTAGKILVDPADEPDGDFVDDAH
jgi:hypothetical protein